MLEVKHLRKEYKTKKGVITKALDDVSITFPETGMVFILGKSGSGKSTLLNVCGGLDKADSGEIVIKGKSSASFSGQDFDSYRNTYVGFVFQEYNILDEFTVEDNIALALELQNKKRDKEVITKILADVEMEQYASRKPNTLSGGQKQRVAIARALVKAPEIIMADEPTGALDSNTGKQVFDTLKKLSREKLVLVISHDRDFAEQYGDRIIELKDGKVLSDMTRAPESEENKNVRFYGTDTVCVTDGGKVTDEDMEKIRKFLSQAGGSAVISTSREKIGEFRRDRPEINVGSFCELETQPESKTYPPQKLIRSHFPLRHAFKMGASGLKSKPVRLVFTMLLSIIAFVMFGLASTVMLFNERSVAIESFENSNYEYITLKKGYFVDAKYYEYGKYVDSDERMETTAYTLEEYNALRAKYAGAMAAINFEYSRIDNFDMPGLLTQYYSDSLDGAVIVNDSLPVLAGRLPIAADEVAVSDFLKKKIKAGKLYADEDRNTEVELTDYAGLIDTDNPKVLILNNHTCKITGIYKGSIVPDKYAELKRAADSGQQNTDFITQYNWQNERASGLFSRIAVSEEFFEANKDVVSGIQGINMSEYFDYGKMQLKLSNENNSFSVEISGTSKYGENNVHSKEFPLWSLHGDKVTALAENQIGVPYSVIMQLTEPFAESLLWQESDESKKLYEQIYVRVYDEFVKENPEPQKPAHDASEEEWAEHWRKWTAWEQELNNAVEKEWEKANPLILLRKHYESLTRESLSPDTAREYLQEWIAFVENSGIEIPLALTVHSDYFGDKAVRIGGVYYEIGKGFNPDCYMSDELYDAFYVEPDRGSWWWEFETKYVPDENAYISSVFIPYDKSNALTTELIDLTYKRADDDSTTLIGNALMDEILLVSDVADSLGTVFLWTGIIFAVFSFLLMFNFISVSIAAKQKEIGILRAIGARTLDVFKIFLSEACIIALICFAVSAFASAGICVLINGILMTNTILSVTLFVFGPISVLCILGITLVTATFSTLLPVTIYSRKPPVASIRAL